MISQSKLVIDNYFMFVLYYIIFIPPWITGHACMHACAQLIFPRLQLLPEAASPWHLKLKKKNPNRPLVFFLIRILFYFYYFFKKHAIQRKTVRWIFRQSEVIGHQLAGLSSLFLRNIVFQLPICRRPIGGGKWQFQFRDFSRIL